MTALASLGLLLVGLPLAGRAAAVGAAPAGPANLPPYLADAKDPAVTTLAEDMGIPVPEAQRRIGWQEPALQLDEDLRRALGDQFGGLWIDAAGGGRVKVGVVGAGATNRALGIIARYKLDSVTDLVPVRHSYAELEQANAWLSSAAAKASPAAEGATSGLMSALLTDKNQVELQLPRNQRLNPAQQATVREAKRRFGTMLALGSWSGKVVKEACAWTTATFCDPPLRAGVGIDDTDAGDVPSCTAAFNARSKSDGKWYVLTAGHCGPIGGSWNTYIPSTNSRVGIGQMWNKKVSGWEDFGMITNANDEYFDPGPYIYVNSSPETPTYAPLYPVHGVSGSKIGTRVCISGAFSSSDCGNVKKLNYGGLNGFGVVDYCSVSGDSGSPIFSLNRARGIHAGTVAGAAACKDRLFQGVSRAAQLLKVYVVTTAAP